MGEDRAKNLKKHAKLLIFVVIEFEGIFVWNHSMERIAKKHETAVFHGKNCDFCFLLQAPIRHPSSGVTVITISVIIIWPTANMARYLSL